MGAVTINLIACILIIAAILMGIFIADGFNKQNAMLNEYEYALAGVWAGEQDCEDQMGVFYVKPGKEKKWR